MRTVVSDEDDVGVFADEEGLHLQITSKRIHLVFTNAVSVPVVEKLMKLVSSLTLDSDSLELDKESLDQLIDSILKK